MKKTLLLFTLLLGCMWGAAAQAPTIEGDIMLCPNTNGTAFIAGNTTYDTYQWQVRFYLQQDFSPVAGATSSSFTYDWYNYDQATIKLTVTQNGQTYESNTLQIDSWNWSPLFIVSDLGDGVTTNPDNGNFMMCPGESVTNTIPDIWENIQWYKDGQAIEGATQSTYTITQPGVYHVVASPEMCLGSSNSTAANPIVAVLDANCENTNPAAPVIAGDTMLCPNTNGTATVTNNQTYDTYQWYFKYWFLNDEFQPIEGATSASFTYDWFTYDQALFKLVVTLDGQTYESNTIQIDSWNWTPLTIVSTLGEGITVNPDNGNFMMCEGETVENVINEFFVNVQWYKDGQPIEGATQNNYTITEPGSYYATASPSICVNFTNSTATQPIVAALDPECALNVNNPAGNNNITLYPNPATSVINISLPSNTAINHYDVIDITGKTLLSGEVSSASATVNISSLAQGSYIVKLTGANTQVTKMVIKQ